MPPRLSIQRVCRSCQLLLTSTSTLRPLFQPSSIAIFTNPSARSASILSSLSDNPGAYSKKIRRGRGPSSGKGKTSGRGHKGQKQHGKVPAGFNGGQTPLEVVHGKRGFKNVFSLDMSPLNLDRIQTWIDQGRLDPSRVITLKELCASRCLHGIKDGVKLLARVSETIETLLWVFGADYNFRARSFSGRQLTLWSLARRLKRSLRSRQWVVQFRHASTIDLPFAG